MHNPTKRRRSALEVGTGQSSTAETLRNASDRYASRRDAVPKEAELAAAEFTLGGLDVEPLLPEDREDLADVLEMLFERRAVAEHVVHVHPY